MSEKIKLKESAYILKESDDVYKLVLTATRRIKRFQVDDLVKDAIDCMKSENDVAKVISSLKNKYAEEEVFACLNAMEESGIITRYDHSQINPRYQRQISFIDEITESWEETVALQTKLENSTIAIFGVGGIGTWIVNGLYQLGIGNIRIVDPDTVSKSNLNRQLYFTEADVGKYKVEVITEKLVDAKIQSFRKYVSADENLEDIIVGCDFLVNCADSPSVEQTSRVINKYACKYNLPYSIAGGYNMHLGMIGPIIVPKKTACLDCFLEYQKENDPFKSSEKIKDVEQTGSLGPITGVVANFQVMEIFKYLIGKGNVNVNQFAEIDFMNFNVQWHQYSKKKDCTCNK